MNEKEKKNDINDQLLIVEKFYLKGITDNKWWLISANAASQKMYKEIKKIKIFKCRTKNLSIQLS